MRYLTRGTCAMAIDFELDGDIIKSVKFLGGCHGNTQGIAKLVEGMKIDDVIEKLEGTDCGGRGTSCPDQLARALKEAKKNMQQKNTTAAPIKGLRLTVRHIQVYQLILYIGIYLNQLPTFMYSFLSKQVIFDHIYSKLPTRLLTNLIQQVNFNFL